MYKQDEVRAPLDPSSRIASRLKVAAPMHMAKKNSFLSAPKLSGAVKSTDKLCSPAWRSALLAPDRKCGLIPASRKEPGHEVHGGDGHANTEQDSGKDPLRPAFPKPAPQRFFSFVPGVPRSTRELSCVIAARTEAKED